MDDDLWPDLYVVNVTATEGSPYHRDHFWLSNGDGTFADLSETLPGIGTDAQAGMGVDVADIDLDGDWDVYVTDLIGTTEDDLPLGNVLYLNQGDRTFADNSAPEAGIAGDDSWGVNFFDADHDGWEDLFAAHMKNAAAPLFFVNDRDGTFTNQGADLGISTTNSRGSACADYDRDGDVDFALVNQGGGLQLFRNETPDLGHWLRLALAGTTSNRDGIGAVVEVAAGGLEMMRQVKGGSSGHGQDSLEIHFGLGDATVADEVRIRWPSGETTVLTAVAGDRTLYMTEGSECTAGDDELDLTDVGEVSDSATERGCDAIVAGGDGAGYVITESGERTLEAPVIRLTNGFRVVGGRLVTRNVVP